MSYIENKYLKSIYETFNELTGLEKSLVKILELKSIQSSEEIAKLCSDLNKKINLILKKYYPEIKSMSDKLDIKSILKFYFDLLDKMTDFVRNVEDFQKIDDRYYETFIDFILDKESLISGKYRDICSQELTAFYDKKTREHLEEILEEKFARHERQFFAMGPLEEEIKKFGKIMGADEVTILPAKIMHLEEFKIIDNPQSIINYSVLDDDEETLKNVGRELREFLMSKGYKAVIMVIELTDLVTEREALTANIITDAKLLPDK